MASCNHKEAGVQELLANNLCVERRAHFYNYSSIPQTLTYGNVF